MKKTLTNNLQGYGLIHFLVFSSLTALMSATILSLIMNFNRISKLEVSKLKDSISADHCLSGVISLTANLNIINGLETIHWYNSVKDLNKLTQQFLTKHTNVNRIAPDSPILETISIVLPILHKDSDAKQIIYTSPFKFADFDNLSQSNTLLMINPWHSSIVKVKQKRETLTGRGMRVTFLENPTPILTFGSKNYVDPFDLSTLNKSRWIAAIKNFGIAYRTENNTFEYRSLLTSDVQPMCEKLTKFSRIDSTCEMEVGLNSLRPELRSFSCINNDLHPLTKLNMLDIW